MKIYFLETGLADEEFFEEALRGHTLHFVDSLSEVARDAEIFSGFIHSPIDEAFLEGHPGLMLIATRSTAYYHIDVKSCANHHVTVCRVDSYGDSVVAEHAFALLLALARRLREAMTVKASSYFSYESLRGMALKSKTLGLVGAGRVGQNMVPIARGFGMRVIACDIRRSPDLARRLGFQYVGFEELLHRSDVLSLHASLTPATYHILDEAAFAECRPGVLVINTAHGKLIHTDALIKALDEEIVGGAGLDVLGEESVLRHHAWHVIREEILERMQGRSADRESSVLYPERAMHLAKVMRLGDLLQRQNVVFTPHTAFNCAEAVERINRITVENIENFVAGEPANIVPPELAEFAMGQPAAEAERFEQASGVE